MILLDKIGDVTYSVEAAIDQLANKIEDLNDRWWHDPLTGLPIKRNTGEMLMLVVSELAEALEGDRKGLRDDKLPQYQMFDVEIADTLIRLFDIAGHLIPNIGEILQAKLEYNMKREDHTLEHRLGEGGKKY